MTVPPEIKRLRENCVVNVWRCPECGRAIAEIEHHEGYCDGTLATPHPRRAWEVDAYLALADAEQAVRDAEARVRAGSLRDGMQRAFAEGVAAERARILALLDEPRAYRLALAEYAARREQGHDRFEAMRLAVAAVRALVGGDA